jgi:vancomycin resistance protein YoaR
MDGRQTKMSTRKKGAYAGKIKKATQMLFYKRHAKPGVKGWELHKAIGADYPKVLNVLDDYLKPMDLQVKTVFEEEKAPEKPTVEELDKARFFIALRDVETKDKLMGWRVDDLAGLAITISYIVAKKGQATRKDVEKLLGEKIANWKVSLNLDRYIRNGYLMQDDKGQLFLDWRTRAEVDQKKLIDMLLNTEKQKVDLEQQPQEESAEGANKEENSL